MYSISSFYSHLIMTFWKRRNVVPCFITFYRRILLSNNNNNGICSGISTRWLFIHCFRIELEFGMLVFVEGGKPENSEKNPRSRDENQQQTQPTCDAGFGNRTRATVVGGECSHHCAIPAPLLSINDPISFQVRLILSLFNSNCFDR